MLSTVSAYGDTRLDDTNHSRPMSMTMTLTRSARRGPWLPEEDQALIRLVRIQGANNWVRISQQIQHRSPKQCRERYHQNLKPSLKHDPISSQEGEMIERLVQEMGKRWAEIARRLGNRSDNAVKNWWNGSVNRRRRNPAQATTNFKQVGLRLQPTSLTLSSGGYISQHSQSTLDSNRVPTTAVYEAHPQQHTYLQSQVSDPTTRIPSTTSIDCPVKVSGHHLASSRSQAPGSKPTLPAIYPPKFRPELPPLKSFPLNVHRADWTLSAADRAPISPALSDASQRHAPSLVSDTQSMHSISPRTIPTPQPGSLASIEISTSNWSDIQLSSHHGIHHTEYKSLYSADSGKRHAIFHVNDEKSKDSRMELSTLLR